MLDIKLIREKPEEVKKNTKNRGYDFNLVDNILNLDKKWRELSKQVQETNRFDPPVYLVK